MNNGKGIVTIGTVFVDIKGFPYNSYIPAGRNAGWVETVHGGVGRNVAEDIANIELCPTFVGMVDESAQAEEVLRRLRQHKVNTDHVIRVPDGMGIWLAVFDETGDVAGSISKRPAMQPLTDYLAENGDEIFADCDSIVIEIDIDKELVKKVFRFAEKYNKKVYAVVSNMSIAAERRDFLKQTDCFVCNAQEAGILFLEEYEGKSPEEMREIIARKVVDAGISAMVVTMGEKGSVYASREGENGICPALKVGVVDTTGAGDAFCAGVAAGLTYGRNLKEAAEIGTKLAAAVITVSENVCPRFQPEELGLSKPGRKQEQFFEYEDEDIVK